MKTTIACLLVIVLLFALTPAPAPETEVYPLATVVVEVNREADTVLCEDFNGNLWEFYGAEDWMEGDIATLLMNDCDTANIYDDEIVSAHYDGYFEGWMD